MTIPIGRIWNYLASTAFILWALSLIFHGLFLLTGHNNVFGLAPFLTLDNEINLPTFFSALLLLVAAITLLCIGILEKSYRFWRWLSALFLYLAMDELLMIHDSWGFYARFLRLPSNGLFTFAWIYPGLLLVLATWLFLRKSLARLPSHTFQRFLLAGTVYIGGAIGIEFITGLYGSLKQLSYYELATTGPYLFLSDLEEGLEMLGILLFIQALFLYLKQHHPQVDLCFQN